MRVFVGRNLLEGDIERYAARFDLLEVQSDAANLPRNARLAEWQTRVPPGFVFSVVLPKLTSALESSEPSLGRTLEVADVLRARWLLVQTPATVVPSARMRARLAQLFVELRGGERQIAWEPRGIWEDLPAEAFAREQGVHLVRDLARAEPPEGPSVYTRIRALGDSGHVRASAVARVAEYLAECEEALIVIEGRGAAEAARLLHAELDS